MSIYYLMIKTHKKTGLKYLCQSKQKNQNKYKGSGVDWTSHRRKHGNDVHTEIIRECSSKEELSYWGRYYSTLFNVVGAMDDFGNKIWANMIPETGGGGGFTKETHEKLIEYNEEAIRNGTHPLQKRKDGTSVALDKVRDGTHHLLKRSDGTSLSSDRVAAGLNNLGSDFNKRMVAEGKHSSQNKDAVKKISDKANARLANGTHNLLSLPNPNSTRVCCVHCKHETTLPVLSRSHRDAECLKKKSRRR